MSVTKFSKDMSIIAALADNPRADGMTTETFKAKFDEGGEALKTYINEVLIPAVEAIESGAIEVSDTKPDLAPCFWVDTSGDYPLLKYIDSLGYVISIRPATTIDAVDGLSDELDSLTTVSVSIPVNAWSTTSPFMQSVSVPGMTENWIPGTPCLIPSGTQDGDVRMQEAAACISKITSSEGALTFTCYEEKPDVLLNLRIPGLKE